MQAVFPDPLAVLPDHILGHITGERRRRLVEYLLRWGMPAAALRALDVWLAAQPHLVTLREARARVLIEDGRAKQALAALDAIDAERGMSESRRALRLRCLAALGRWDAAHALLPDRPDDPAVWRLRADLLCRQTRFAEAAQAYQRAAELLPEEGAPIRGLAELALAQGNAAYARTLLRDRRDRPTDAPVAAAELLLLRQAAERLGDIADQALLDARLAERRAEELAALCDAIGLDPQEDTQRDNENTLLVSPPSNLLAEPEPELPPEALAILREHFGYDTFRPGQPEVIARVLRGESLLAVLPTGAGKSLTYQLPALLLPDATLVLSPLIALMKDQIDNLPPALAQRATAIHSALDGGEVAARLRGVAEGRYKLIYVAPERLRQQPFVQALRRAGVSRVVVDEAHCVSLWGISFRPDYLFIRRAIEALGAPPVLALTATATPDTEAEIKTHLAPNRPIHEEHEDHEDKETIRSSRPFVSSVDHKMATVRTSVFRPNLRFEVRHVANKREKVDAVVELCQSIDGPIVVYARSRDTCEQLAARLRDHRIAAEHYHALVADRHGVQDRFMRGATRVLVATVAFGMGVDKADVRAIVHYNLPQSVEAYYQEAGRAGRDGLPARCILLYAAADKGQLTAWLREELLSKEYVRDVYRSLRGRLRDGWGIAAIDDLRRDLREQDETRLRVALGLLERVGLVARHFDLPRAATLLLRDETFDDADFHSFVQLARLRPGQALDVDLLDLAGRAGCQPDDLELRLLRWSERGLLRYDGSARDMLLHLLPAPADVGSRLDALLAEYAARQDARIDVIARYARGARCRHQAIAAHFGEHLARCARSCDICAPDARTTSDKRQVLSRAKGRTARAQRPLPVTAGRESPATGARARDHTAEETILGCLAQLPFPVGRSGLAKVLKGAATSPIGPDRCPQFAALGDMTLAAIEAAIEQLVESGHLARHAKGYMPLLVLTARGTATIAGDVVQ